MTPDEFREVRDLIEKKVKSRAVIPG